MNIKPILTFLVTVLLFPNINFGQNPIIQTCYTADPAPMVYKDTVYLYTGHDEDKSTWFTMKDWKCYSTTDMVNWTDHGSPLSLKTFAWAKKDAWAGQCIFRNGKFYWYVPMNRADGKGMAIGVAIGNRPTGPFVDAIGHPLTYTGTGDIDPTVYIDDDGQAWLYWGNPNLYYVKLNEDMISYSGEIVKVPLTESGFGKRFGDPKRSTLYEEGPWFYKRSGLYYLLYPAGGVPEHLAYSTSKGPIGPWVYQDTIMRIIRKGGAFTNHPGLIDYKGKTYLFYHNGALPGGGGFTRSVCVEEFKYNTDGTIPRITNTVEGITKSAGNLNPFIRNEAETIAWEVGVKTEMSPEAGVYVTSINNNDYIKVRSVDFDNGAKSFEANVATASQGGKIEILIDSLAGSLLGTCSIEENSGDWKKWITKKCKVTRIKGIHDLYFVFTGGEGDLFNFNWWKFSR
jgi:arabinoxylan arabinofuranohydrolase